MFSQGPTISLTFCDRHNIEEPTEQDYLCLLTFKEKYLRPMYIMSRQLQLRLEEHEIPFFIREAKRRGEVVVTDFAWMTSSEGEEMEGVEV